MSSELVYGLGALLVSFLTFRSYKKWRRSKSKENGYERIVEAGDLNLFISYWGVILIFFMSFLILILKAIFDIK
jgi:hypothetical protein